MAEKTCPVCGGATQAVIGGSQCLGACRLVLGGAECTCASPVTVMCRVGIWFCRTCGEISRLAHRLRPTAIGRIPGEMVPHGTIFTAEIPAPPPPPPSRTLKWLDDRLRALNAHVDHATCSHGPWSVKMTSDLAKVSVTTTGHDLESALIAAMDKLSAWLDLCETTRAQKGK